MRRPATGRPRAKAVAASPAITPARSTDGSNRVSRQKNAMTPTVRNQRGPSRSRRSTGATSASTKATFSPDTARRCVSPDPRKSSVRVTGWSRSSPNTKPVKSERGPGAITPAPRTRVRRSTLAARQGAVPGPAAGRPARRGQHADDVARHEPRRPRPATARSARRRSPARRPGSGSRTERPAPRTCEQQPTPPDPSVGLRRAEAVDRIGQQRDGAAERRQPAGRRPATGPMAPWSTRTAARPSSSSGHSRRRRTSQADDGHARDRGHRVGGHRAPTQISAASTTSRRVGERRAALGAGGGAGPTSPEPTCGLGGADGRTRVHTRAWGRSRASLAGPMPRTLSRSSTVAKRPWAVR